MINKERFDSFLESYQFYSNSISFRIHSSKALEKFKNVQAFQLNQLVNGRFYFSIDRREILLLKYDMSSRFLYEMENMCIELSSARSIKVSTQEDINIITDFYEKTSLIYKDIIFKKYTKHFDLKFSKIWFEAHQFIHKLMIDKINKLVNLPLEVLFTRLVDALIEILQYTLIEIHEIDSLITNINNNDEIFMVITELSRKQPKDNCPFNHRLNVYKKYFDIKSLYFKNYTDHLIPKHIVETVELNDININYKKSMFN